MQTGYFNAAWQDIKNTPGWFGKLILLSLLSFVPIFGWLVVLGYLYGWARDIAWDVHGPMPKHIFGNEDRKLYSRGFFAMVIGFLPHNIRIPDDRNRRSSLNPALPGKRSHS